MRKAYLQEARQAASIRTRVSWKISSLFVSSQVCTANLYFIPKPNHSHHGGEIFAWCEYTKIRLCCRACADGREAFWRFAVMERGAGCSALLCSPASLTSTPPPSGAS